MATSPDKLSTNAEKLLLKFKKQKQPHIPKSKLPAPGVSPALDELLQTGQIQSFQSGRATYFHLEERAPARILRSKFEEDPEVIWTEEAVKGIGGPAKGSHFLKVVRELVSSGEIKVVSLRPTFRGGLRVGFAWNGSAASHRDVSFERILGVSKAHMQRNLDGTASIGEVARELDCHPNAVKEMLAQKLATHSVTLIEGFDTTGIQEAVFIRDGIHFFRYRLKE